MWKYLTLERVSSNNKIFSMKNEKRTLVPYILISSILACAALYFMEQEIEGINYAIKTGVKLLFFLIIPGIHFVFTKDKNIYISTASRTNEKKSLFIGLFSGLLFFAILIGVYYLLQSFINFEPIISDLQTRLNVTPLNFIFVGIYITLGNSFIEEFFFRGFVFLGVYKSGKPVTAYLFSSLLFALYHIMIFRSWFTLPLFLLAVFGLFSVGILFNWMDMKSRNFVNSWISHILADVAIILIGLKMFGIVNF